MGPQGPELNWNKFRFSYEFGPLQVKWWYHMFSSIKMEEYMESEPSDIFWVKLVAKNIVLASPGTHFMHMRVKKHLKIIWRRLGSFYINNILIFDFFSKLIFEPDFSWVELRKKHWSMKKLDNNVLCCAGSASTIAMWYCAGSASTIAIWW